jgi:hypothetical protein
MAPGWLTAHEVSARLVVQSGVTYSVYWPNSLDPGTLPMLAACPGCSRTLKVPDAVAGMRIRCPVCQSVVRVPVPERVPDCDAPLPASSRRSSRPEAASHGSSSAAGKPWSDAAMNTATNMRAGTTSRVASSSDDVVEDFGASLDLDPWTAGHAGESRRAADADWDVNPFAAPATPQSSPAGRQVTRSGSEDVMRKCRFVGVGLLMQAWSLTLAVIFAGGMLGLGYLLVMGSGGRSPSIPLVLLLGIAGCCAIAAGLTVLAGQGLCLAIPEESGARQWIIASLACMAGQFVLNLAGSAAGRSGSAFSGGQVPITIAMMIALLGMITSLAQIICFQLFLQKTALYVNRPDLARQAMIILIGGVVCGGLFLLAVSATSIATGIFGNAAAVFFLTSQVMSIAAMIVFAVMYVALLFRLGTALRA